MHDVSGVGSTPVFRLPSVYRHGSFIISGNGQDRKLSLIVQ
jgi:hypothetical protein